jgi:hypothetical protein
MAAPAAAAAPGAKPLTTRDERPLSDALVARDARTLSSARRVAGDAGAESTRRARGLFYEGTGDPALATVLRTESGSRRPSSARCARCWAGQLHLARRARDVRDVRARAQAEHGAALSLTRVASRAIKR